MPKFSVHKIAQVSYLVGEYEAETLEEAESMADDDPQNDEPCLCHHCSDEIDMGDYFDYRTSPIEGTK